jgi:hypothetical protein
MSTAAGVMQWLQALQALAAMSGDLQGPVSRFTC